MRIPWWVKIAAKVILSRFPIKYAVWQQLGFFRHGKMDASKYAVDVFHSHCVRASIEKTLPGKTILELGPGDSIATSIIASAHGARAILVDSGRFVRSDIEPYSELVNTLRERGLDTPDIVNCENINQILQSCNATYMTDGVQSLRQIDERSVDFIFSHAVLEHIRKKDFSNCMSECRRILKSGGICSHQVDLRDHLDGRHNNLRFSEKVWESNLFAKSGFYTNRILFSQMLDAFEQAGFQARVTDVRHWDGLPTPRNRLSREFKRASDSDLLVSGFHVILN